MDIVPLNHQVVTAVWLYQFRPSNGWFGTFMFGGGDDGFVLFCFVLLLFVSDTTIFFQPLGVCCRCCRGSSLVD